MPKRTISAEEVLQALGDPTRRAIVERLSERPHSLSSLAAPLGVTVTAVAQHMQVLEACGLAQTEKIGRVRSCTLRREGLDALADWIAARRSTLDRQLDRLGALLDEDGEGIV